MMKSLAVIWSPGAKADNNSVVEGITRGAGLQMILEGSVASGVQLQAAAVMSEQGVPLREMYSSQTPSPPPCEGPTPDGGVIVTLYSPT